LAGATLVWRSWSAPPISDGRAWRLPDGTVMEAANPDAKPPRGAVEPVAPRSWDHDHCDFCWAAFMAATGPRGQQKVREGDPEVFTAGYTPADPATARVWICSACFEDFRDRFGWTVVGEGPAG
jgi:hypothetical protein